MIETTSVIITEILSPVYDKRNNVGIWIKNIGITERSMILEV